MGQPWARGQKVEKTTGYKFPGEVVAAFYTRMGKLRYVIECTADDVEGILHIFRPDQLRKK